MESEDENKSAGHESIFRRKRKGSKVDNKSGNQLKKPRSDSLDDIENGIENKPDTNKIRAISHEQKDAKAQPVSDEQKEAQAEPVSYELKEAHVEPVSNEKKEAHAEPISNEQKGAHAEPESNEQKEVHADPISNEQKDAHAEPISNEQKGAHAEPVSNEQKEAHVESISKEQKEAHAEPESNEQKEAHAEPVSYEQKEAHAVDLPSTCSTEESKEVGEYIPISSCNDIGIFAELDNPVSCNVNENDKILDNQEKEDIAAHEINVEQSCQTPQPGTSHDNGAIEKDEYVYRLLRCNESYRQGLYPKNINSSITLQEHVENGSSKGHSSQFISCCKTLSGLIELGGITNNRHSVRIVVRVNITKLNSREVTVIDLTNENIRQNHIDRDSSAWGYARRFEEVILQPQSHVPADCVEKIGKVQQRRFTKHQNINL